MATGLCGVTVHPRDCKQGEPLDREELCPKYTWTSKARRSASMGVVQPSGIGGKQRHGSVLWLWATSLSLSFLLFF